MKYSTVFFIDFLESEEQGLRETRRYFELL